MPLIFRLIADGLADGTFDTSIPPMFIIIAMMALGGPGQLIFRAIEGYSPFPPPADGVSQPERMLGILLKGVGGRASAGDRQ